MLDSAGRHDRAAEKHEAAARVVEGLPANAICADQVLEDNLTSGTEPIAFHWQPCYDTTRDAGHSRRYLAREERRKATAERKRALQLRSAELERAGGG